MKPCVCSFIGLAANWKEKTQIKTKEEKNPGKKENTWVEGRRKGEGGGEGDRVNCAGDVPSHLRIKGLSWGLLRTFLDVPFNGELL